MFNRIVARLHGESAQAMDEYAFCAALVFLAVFVAFKLLSLAVQAEFIAETNTLCDTPPCAK